MVEFRGNGVHSWLGPTTGVDFPMGGLDMKGIQGIYRDNGELYNWYWYVKPEQSQKNVNIKTGHSAKQAATTLMLDPLYTRDPV